MAMWTAVAAVLLAGLLAYMVAQAFAVSLTRVRMECPRLPREFDGFRILQFSDLHMSQLGSRERRLHRLTRGLSPDISVLTGDLAAEEVSARELAMVAEDSDAEMGMYAISGNADVRYPQAWAGVKRVLREEGIEVLENEHRVLTRDGASIVLAGVDDPHTGQDDLPAALRGAPEGTFILLLAHSPAIIIPAIEMGCDVVLSGHTHGGQLVLPGIGPLLTRSGYGQKLSSGLFAGEKLRRVIGVDPGNTQIYISRGIGSSFLPIRLLCRPEVTLFELVRPGDPSS